VRGTCFKAAFASFVLAFAFCFTGSALVAATDQYWKGGFCSEEAPGNINTATNWSNNTVPNGNYNPIFTNENGTVTYLTNTAGSDTERGCDTRFRRGDYVFNGGFMTKSIASMGASTYGDTSVTKTGDWILSWGGFYIGTGGRVGAFTNESGLVSVWRNGDGKSYQEGSCVRVGSNGIGYLTINGGSVEIFNAFYAGWQSGDVAYITVNGGQLKFDRGSRDQLRSHFNLGHASGSTAYFTQNGGTVTIQDKITYAGKGGTAYMYLNGGTFITQQIYSDSRQGTVIFNGGTYKVNGNYNDFGGILGFSSGLKVKVGDNGGTIDTGGAWRYMDNFIMPDGESTGGMTIKGGATLCMNGVNTYRGRTTIELGTIVQVSSPAVIPNGIAITKPGTLADGIYTVLASTNGAFEASITNDVALPAGCKLLLSPDRTSVSCKVGKDVDCFWTGAAGDTLFSNPENWLDGAAPQPGVAQSIMLNGFGFGGVFTNDIAGLTPSSVSYSGDGTGKVYPAEGAGDYSLQNLRAVSNLSTTANIVFELPVFYADGATMEVYHTGTVYDSNRVASFTKEKGLVVFNGGVTGYEIPARTSGPHNIYAGHWFRTNTTALTANIDNNWIKSVYKNSSLTTDSTTGTWALYIGSGGAVTTRTSFVSSTSLLFGKNEGEFVVTGVVTGQVAGSKCPALGANSSFKVKMEKMVVTGTPGSTKNLWFFLGNEATGSASHTVYVGDGGLQYASTNDSPQAYYSTGGKESKTGDSTTLRPWHNGFTIGERGCKNIFWICRNTTTFNTDNEAGEGKTITVNTKTADKGAMVISGKGTVRYNLADGVNEHSGTITVQSPATFELGAGVKSGTGAVTVNSGATLSLPESGTMTIGGNFVLANGAVLSFGINGASDTTIAVDSGKTLTVNGTAAIEFAEGSSFASGRKYTLLSGGNLSDASMFALPEGDRGSLSVEGGNLVYTAPHFYIIVR
jgi:autotransporter-associated beta strand protein